jgi:o-succinylbenzoate synthase
MTAPLIERVDLVPYRLPLARVWASARGNFRERRGWLVSVGSGDLRGYGDCAPLPEAGTETAEIAAQRLPEQRAKLTGMTLDQALEALLTHADHRTPAADFALDCALSDLRSRLAGTSLRRWLAADAPAQVPVNGALGPLAETTRADLERAARAGFRVVKLKVGIDAPDRELERLDALAATLPDRLGLRLDANGAWDPGTATRVVSALRALPGLRIESLEEPLREPDWATLARLQSIAGFPLALDESIPPLGVDFDPAGFPVRRAVLKPAAIGGLRRTLALARRLSAAGIEVVVTSLIESAAGLWPTAQLAAAIGSPIPQGLATADWLAENLGPPPRPVAGYLRLPETVGSGFAPYAT